MQSWKSSWDSKALSPTSEKSQLKTALFSQQHSTSLEAYLKNLLKTLHVRAERLKETVHLGEQCDFRECSSQSQSKPKARTKQSQLSNRIKSR